MFRGLTGQTGDSRAVSAIASGKVARTKVMTSNAMGLVDLPKRASAVIIGITGQGTPLAKACDILLPGGCP